MKKAKTIIAGVMGNEETQQRFTSKPPKGARWMATVGPSGSVFVKDYDFFVEQGGFSEPWGKSWVEIYAPTHEEARKKACNLPGALPWERQA